MQPGGTTLDVAGLGACEILEALADGAYLTDNDRRIVFWNRAAERITGWRAAEVVGRHCRDNVLAHCDQDGQPLCGFEYCPLHRAMVTGQPSASPLLVFARARDGRRLPVEVTVAPIRARTGAVLGGIEIFRDMSPAMDDLQRARHIQQQALAAPLADDARLRVARRYIPESLIGGDFCRVERLDRNRYAVMVADVTGHGIAAALYAMQLRSFWEDHRRLLAAPDRFLNIVNRRLAALFNGEGYFASGWSGVVNAATGEVNYANAGHPTPLLVSRAGQPRCLEGHGAALGLFADAPYRCFRTRLDCGETLLVYTDGAFEIMNSEQQELDVEGLMDYVAGLDLSRGEAALDQLREKLLKYSNQLRLPDDLTLVSLHRPA